MMKSGRLFIVHFCMALMPSTRCFSIKCKLLRWAGAVVGSNVRIVSSSRFYLAGRLVIGDDTWIGHEVLIVGGDADVVIGSRVDIAPRVTLVTGSHELFTIKGRAAGNGYSSPITIRDGAWIGASSTILGGVVVGSCGVVAAGALVKSDVKDGCIYGGVPAKNIGNLKKRDFL
jgi:acetyltransferase-like isoleucine patch superfamily enzyme